MTIENNSMTIDTTGVDIDAELKAAESREKEYLQSQRQGFTEETPKPDAGPKGERPDDVPEEFWNAEEGKVDWPKLNERLKSGDQKPVEEPEATGEAINGVALTTKHSEDFDPFYQAFSKDGTVSDDAVKYVKDTFGIDASKEMIGAYMSGQLAKVSGQASEVSAAIRTEGLAVVGGEANYSDMSNWAQGVLSDAEMAEYDEAVEGKDPKVAKLAVQALWNRYRAEATIEPKILAGRGRTEPTAGDVYNSVSEMAADTMKPAYSDPHDTSFRRKVDAKINRSTHLHIPKY